MYSWHIISHFLWFPSRKLDCLIAATCACLHVGQNLICSNGNLYYASILYWPQGIQPTEVGSRTTVFYVMQVPLKEFKAYIGFVMWRIGHIWADNWGSQSVKLHLNKQATKTLIPRKWLAFQFCMWTPGKTCKTACCSHPGFVHYQHDKSTNERYIWDLQTIIVLWLQSILLEMQTEKSTTGVKKSQSWQRPAGSLLVCRLSLKVLLPCLVARKLFKLSLHGRIGSSQWQDPRMWSLVVEMSKKHMRQVSLHLTEFYFLSCLWLPFLVAVFWALQASFVAGSLWLLQSRCEKLYTNCACFGNWS